MRTKNLPNQGEGLALSCYVAPEVLLHEFSAERGFADSVTTVDAWRKSEEEEL